MSNNALKTFSTRATPQNEHATSNQVLNNAGGYTFGINDVSRLKRFLILGSESTYYANSQGLTHDNAEVVLRMAENDSRTLVDTIVDVSLRGAAPKVDQTLFALAIAASHGSDEDKTYALSKLSLVARTGTHLTLFVDYVQQFRGWGRGLRSAVGSWYTSKNADQLAYQVVKYGNRNGWTHRDILRKSHGSSVDPELNAVLRWVTQGETGEHTPHLIEGYLKAKEAGDNPSRIVSLLNEYPSLSWEMLPTQARTYPQVWNALLDNGMGTTALIRQLPTLTRLGLFEGSRNRTRDVIAQITDHDTLRASHIHPMALLEAEKTYSKGRSLRGDSTWTPKRQIVDALSDAFLDSFENVEPTGKRFCYALDVSGSMGCFPIAGSSLTPREASAALALISMFVEEETECIAFTSGSIATYKSKNGSYSYRGGDGITELNISPRQRLSDAINVVSGLPFGGTDCSLPMLWAMDNNKEFDAFVVVTDNETWAGKIHPHQALQMYREKMGINAKLIVIGMSATEFSIAEPGSTNQLDVVGFDTATPKLISEFAGNAF